MRPFYGGVIVGAAAVMAVNVTSAYGLYRVAVTGYEAGWRDCTAAIRTIAAIEMASP